MSILYYAAAAMISALTLMDTTVSCARLFVDSLAVDRQGNAVQGAQVRGICYGIEQWYQNGGFVNSGVTLTWDKKNSRADVRRAETCGNSYCGPTQQALIDLTGDKSLQISCDEFPFASTEEGGNYYNTLTVNPRQPSRVCVPAWQQTLQGNCNSEFGSSLGQYRWTRADLQLKEILSQMETNIGYLDRRAGNAQATDAWLKWDEESWVTNGASLSGAGPQRTAVYPNQIAKAANINDGVSLLKINCPLCNQSPCSHS